MEQIELEAFTLIGLALPTKTTNENGQAAIDCGSMWQKFETGNYAGKIPGKISNEIVAVYHDYEGDYTKPYSYFIGCKVNGTGEVPTGMDSLVIPKAVYQKFVAKGTIPACIANTWKEIWQAGKNINRAYLADFEIYDERSMDWNNAEVDFFISCK